MTSIRTIETLSNFLSGLLTCERFNIELTLKQNSDNRQLIRAIEEVLEYDAKQNKKEEVWKMKVKHNCKKMEEDWKEKSEYWEKEAKYYKKKSEDCKKKGEIYANKCRCER